MQSVNANLFIRMINTTIFESLRQLSENMKYEKYLFYFEIKFMKKHLFLCYFIFEICIYDLLCHLSVNPVYCLMVCLFAV